MEGRPSSSRRFPQVSDSFSSGVYNSGFKQLFGEVAGFHVDDRIYESQLTLGDIG